MGASAETTMDESARGTLVYGGREGGGSCIRSEIRYGEGGRRQSEVLQGDPSEGVVGWTRYGTCFVVQTDGDRHGVVV